MASVIALLMICAGGTPALAFPAATDGVPTGGDAMPSTDGGEAIDGTSPVMIVLDASGSMNIADAPGPRIDAARQAVIDLVAALPESASIGLLVYGTGTDSSDAARSAGCQDIRLAVPVGPVDQQVFVDAVRGVVASGYTPMGGALRAAAGDLPSTGPASIVLVSDGVDTCAPPSTCDTAGEITAHNPDLVIHTVGFREDEQARQELACVAEAGGGTYRSAVDGAGLAAVLRSQVDAAMRPYLAVGTRVEGTATPRGAPDLANGQFQDTLPAGPAQTRHYSVTLARDQTAHIAATVVPAALRGSGVDSKLGVVAQLMDADGHLCLSTERESETLLAGKVDPVTAVLTGVVDGPEWSKRCPDEGEFVVAVARDSPSVVPTDLEIVVSTDPPVDGEWAAVTVVPAGLPAPEPTPAVPVIGGASFNSAPVLTPGTHQDTLSTGETRYYRIPLAWGQRASFAVTVGPVTGVDQRAGYVRSALADPLRQEVQLASTSNASREFGGPESVSLTGSTLVPVEYGNRGSDRSDIRTYSAAGDYYLSVGMSYPVDALPFTTDITVTVDVVGTATAGPVGRPEPTPALQPATPAESVDAVTAPPPARGSAAAAPGTGGGTAGSAAPAEAAGSAAGWVLAASIGLLILAGGWTWRRRTRRGPRT